MAWEKQTSFSLAFAISGRAIAGAAIAGKGESIDWQAASSTDGVWERACPSRQVAGIVGIGVAGCMIVGEPQLSWTHEGDLNG